MVNERRTQAMELTQAVVKEREMLERLLQMPKKERATDLPKANLSAEEDVKQLTAYEEQA